MCGITVFIGKYKIQQVIDSLYKLQNRGYDSAGISILKNNEFDTYKELNKESIEKLSNILNKLDINNEFLNIIAHTRWATHGGVTINNCHPHISNNKKINLVHNGIIENYDEIKQMLISNNYIFYSQTDSEVICNLIEYNLVNNDIETSIIKSLSICVGTWGLVIQYNYTPDYLYCIKKGSPLLVGKTNDYLIITSEVSGFNNLVTNYNELESNKLYKLSNESKLKYNLSIDYIENEKLTEYKHWTLKEIYDQKNIINKITNNGGRIKNDKCKLGGLFEYKEQIKKSDNIILIGCGTSYNACLYSQQFFYKLCNYKSIICIDACNFNMKYVSKNSNNVFIFVSQSGETKDLYEVLNKVDGIKIGVINVVDSLIARSVDCGVYLNIGKEMSVASTKVFMAQTLVLILIALYLCENKILVKQYITDIRKLDTLITKELEKEVVIKDINNGFIIANNNLFPIALEASLKFKEITYSHIEALSINALKHGPLALVSDKNFINIILGENETVKQEILARDGKVIEIKLNYNNLYNDLLYIIHLQKYNYQLSILKDINPDYPRNLAKVVTV